MFINFLADGYDSNYILRPLENGLFEIVCIDNDRSFAPDIDITETGNPCVGVRSVLFCMDQMQKPFNSAFREEILQLSEVEVRTRDIFIKVG